MKKVRAAIVGYGNIGHYVLEALQAAPDFEIAGVVRRAGAENKPEELANYAVVKDIKELEGVEVAILCTPTRSVEKYAKEYLAMGINTVDSFDIHTGIVDLRRTLDATAKEHKAVSIISAGWDPGMFSLNRLYANAVLPNGNDDTFWGKGVSQGHSDAIRRVAGVADGKQYTIPVDKALEAVRNGENPQLSTREKHIRECFVVPEDGADLDRIEQEIKHMPNYFADYDTTVHFITQEELNQNHSGIPHGGFVIRSGKTGWNEENSHVIEYSLKLDSNPEFTASVIAAYARAACRMKAEGITGCKTVFDIAPAYLSPLSGEELRARML